MRKYLIAASFDFVSYLRQPARMNVGNVIVSRMPERLRPTARGAAAVGSLAVATEVFNWMQRHPDHPVSRALARPGHEFQHRFATAEPTPEQLEVAQAALDACLHRETRAAA